MSTRKRWHVSIAVDGRDKGSWSKETLQPWTAVYEILRYGLCGVGTPWATRGLRDAKSLTITVTAGQPAAKWSPKTTEPAC